jgi:hypothetical protein
MSPLSTWLSSLKNNWNLLSTSASWIGTFAASIILSPNAVFSDEPSFIPWMSKLAIFIIAVIIGLSFLFVSRLNKKNHNWLWGVIALIFLISSTWASLKHSDRAVSLTCACGEQRVVKGDVYKDHESISRFYPNGFDCSNLCQNFKDSTGKVHPEKVWTETSINNFRSTLVRSYISCFPLIAITIISVSQAVYCNQKGKTNKKRRASPVTTETKQPESDEKGVNKKDAKGTRLDTNK